MVIIIVFLDKKDDIVSQIFQHILVVHKLPFEFF